MSGILNAPKIMLPRGASTHGLSYERCVAATHLLGTILARVGSIAYRFALHHAPGVWCVHSMHHRWSRYKIEIISDPIHGRASELICSKCNSSILIVQQQSVVSSFQMNSQDVLEMRVFAPTFDTYRPCLSSYRPSVFVLLHSTVLRFIVVGDGPCC